MKKKYNIKYIQKPGNKTKTPLYEIAPGTWVTRGHTPERKIGKKNGMIILLTLLKIMQDGLDIIIRIKKL